MVSVSSNKQTCWNRTQTQSHPIDSLTTRPPSHIQYLSSLMRKPTMWFWNRSNTNHAVQPQKTPTSRRLKFQIDKKRDCTFRLAKTKALISFAVTAKHADSWFSHEAAQILLNDHSTFSTEPPVSIAATEAVLVG